MPEEIEVNMLYGPRKALETNEYYRFAMAGSLGSERPRLKRDAVIIGE